MKVRKTTDTIVVHCSATPPTADVGVKEITEWHKKNGWETIGYHYVIRRDATVEKGRGTPYVGAHVAGHNSTSVGVCLVGGVDKHGKAENNFTDGQMAALCALLRTLDGLYPKCKVVGHRDLSPDKDGDGVVEPSEWIKECPSFDVKEWLKCGNGG